MKTSYLFFLIWNFYYCRLSLGYIPSQQRSKYLLERPRLLGNDSKNWARRPSRNGDVEGKDLSLTGNPIRRFIGDIFSKLFFFGLEEDRSLAQKRSNLEEIMESKEFQQIKRKNLGNLFLTDNELIALYLTKESSKRKRMRVKASSLPSSSSNSKVKDRQRIPQTSSEIQQEIDSVDKELKIINVSLSAIADDDSSQDKDDLLKNQLWLQRRLNDLKIQLISTQLQEVEDIKNR